MKEARAFGGQSKAPVRRFEAGGPVYCKSAPPDSVTGSGMGVPPVRIVQPTHGRDARATTLGAWHFRWGFPMSLSERIQFGLDECRRALARAGRWLPPLVLAIDGRLKNSIIPH